MTFTKEEINQMIGLKGVDGKAVDIFKLHGVLFAGNSEGGVWDISKTYYRVSESSLGISIDDFGWCHTEEDVHNQFAWSLRAVIEERLLPG